MNWADRVAQAARRAELKDAYLTCAARGARVGERACRHCREVKLTPVYACPHHPQGVVIEEECAHCIRVDIAAITPEAAENLRRKALCAACPEHRMDGDTLRCTVCQCAEPWSLRPWCAAGKWGIDPKSGCIYLREVQDTAKPYACAKGRMSCAECAERTLAPAPDAVPSLTAVLPACNEPDLDNTVASILATPGPVDVLVIDDASDTPIPGAATRHERRWGATRSRQHGAALATGDYLAFPDAHMRFPDGILRRLVEIARETGGIAYCGCNGYTAAELRLMPDGLLYAKWYKPEQVGLVRTSSMMGASYVVSRDVLMRMGGWIGLPGMLGSQELAMSILAARHNVPITCDISMQAWHEFRLDGDLPFRPDHAGWLLNKAATYRLLFEDRTWATIWRPRLETSGMPVSLLAEVERPYIVEYGRKLRERFAVSDEEFLSRFSIHGGV